MSSNEIDPNENWFPFIPIKDEVVYPWIPLPMIVGRGKSRNAINDMAVRLKDVAYLNTDKTVMRYPTQLEESSDVSELEVFKDPEERKRFVFISAQTVEDVPDPGINHVYGVGTVCVVKEIKKGPDGVLRVLFEGLIRAKLGAIRHDAQTNIDYALVEPIPFEPIPTIEEEALRRNVIDKVYELVKEKDTLFPKEMLDDLNLSTRLDVVLSVVATYLPLTLDSRQQLLEETNLYRRSEAIMDIIHYETNINNVQKDLKRRVKQQIDRNQREFYLNEQMKAIQKELGDDDESELQELEKRIKSAKMSKEAEEKALDELRKLRQMPVMSSESTVCRNYIDTLLDLPWTSTKLQENIKEAKDILEKAHYGLEKIKDRILEYLVVHKRVGNLKAPILCLVGPPGVGKTSVGRSIADATGRKYVRIALGGVHDEAEIRGHRRTYIGSMPGRILQSLSKVGTNNPLFLLDEVDKLGMDYRGDPAAALLEVLDPEQNKTFQDHYVEVDYDLSKVMFVATANSLDIPQALLDRMEIINISGYTEDEKVSIAQQYLIPKQKQENGVQEQELEIGEEALRDIIRYYTSEAGVRSLERRIAAICRKVVMRHTLEVDEKESDKLKNEVEGMMKPVDNENVAQLSEDEAKSKALRKRELEKADSEAEGKAEEGKASDEKGKKSKKDSDKQGEEVVYDKVVVGKDDLLELLGVPRYDFDLAQDADKVGLVTGLAWTEVGGVILTIECSALQGKGSIIRTGSLGEVMQESITAALSVVRSRTEKIGLDPDFYEETDIHLHVPEGATPKDGPSAGTAITLAMVSALTKIPVRADVAMTGEITLRGDVLPIGGLKEKLLAALRSGIKHVLIPEKNKKDLEEVPQNVKKDLDIITVKTIDEVLDFALTEKLEDHVKKVEAERKKKEAAKKKTKAEPATTDEAKKPATRTRRKGAGDESK